MITGNTVRPDESGRHASQAWLRMSGGHPHLIIVEGLSFFGLKEKGGLRQAQPERTPVRGSR